jgi:hypothetical protein
VKAIIAVMLLAAMALAGVEIGMGSGLQQRIGEPMAFPLVGQMRMESSAMGLPIEVRGLAMTWEEDNTADGRPLYIQAGAGVGWRFDDLSVFAGGGLSRYEGTIEEGDPCGWLAFRGNLNHAQSMEVMVNYSQAGDEPLGGLATFYWRL